MITVVVRATVSFNEVHIGDVSELELTERVQGLIDGGYLEVLSYREMLNYGEIEAGPGGSAESDPWGEPERAGEDRAPGGEQGEDPVSG